MLFKPVLLKSVLPPERDQLFDAVGMHAEDSLVLLSHQVVDFGSGMHDRLLLLVFNGIGNDLAILFVLHLVRQAMLSQRRLQPESLSAVFALLILDVGVVQARVRQERRFRFEVGTASFTDVRFFSGVSSNVTCKNLRSCKLFVAVTALVPVLVVELDVAVPDAVGGKLLRTILTLEDLLFVGRVFFKPVFLKPVSPLKGL